MGGLEDFLEDAGFQKDVKENSAMSRDPLWGLGNVKTPSERTELQTPSTLRTPSPRTVALQRSRLRCSLELAGSRETDCAALRDAAGVSAPLEIGPEPLP